MIHGYTSRMNGEHFEPDLLSQGKVMKITKPGEYRLRDGGKAIVLCVDAPGSYPLVGYFLYGTDSESSSWTEFGIFQCEYEDESGMDIVGLWIEIPDPGEGWRIINPKIDSPQRPTDEIWTGSEWVQIAYADEFCPDNIYRRRIEPGCDYEDWPIKLVEDLRAWRVYTPSGWHWTMEATISDDRFMGFVYAEDEYLHAQEVMWKSGDDLCYSTIHDDDVLVRPIAVRMRKEGGDGG